MIAAGVTFTIGLILAMSEGAYFPWLNLAGVAIFCLAPVLAWRADRG
jgi:ABC-type transport system involved in cytochrome c biogenesis permease subunit